MNARSGTPSGEPATRQRGAPASGADAAAARAPSAGTSLFLAAAVAGAGALLSALAPLVGVVSPTTPAAFPSWPLLLVVGALPPVLAVLFARRGRSGAAAAVLLGPAALAPGRALVDAQLIADAGLAVRPELLLPRDLDPLSPSTGVWLLLAAHVATVLAGVLAVSGRGARVGDAGASREGEGYRNLRLLGAALFASALGVAGVLMAQFGSDSPYLLPDAALDSPLPVLVGRVLIAVALTGAAGFAIGSPDPDSARGGLLGLASAMAAVSLTPLLGALFTSGLAPGWGPVLGVLSAAVLAVLAVPAGRRPEPREVGDLRLPALTRLLVVAGALAIVAGGLAIAGFATPKLHLPALLSDFTPYTARMLVPAGAVLILLGGACLTRTTARARPALSVAWSAVPLAGAATLDTVLTAEQAVGARVGIGTWLTVAAMVLAGIAAVAAAVAGAVERDDVDLTELSARRAVLGPAVLAGVLAVGAFSLPVVTAPDYTAPGVFTDFGITSWGLLAALVSVLVAVVLAPVCRGSRAAALLCGAAAVVGVRALELPLTGDRAAGAAPGLGLWFCLACLVTLLATALVAARSR